MPAWFCRCGLCLRAAYNLLHHVYVSCKKPIYKNHDFRDSQETRKVASEIQTQFLSPRLENNDIDAGATCILLAAPDFASKTL